MATSDGARQEKRHRKPSTGAGIRLVPKLDAQLRSWIGEHGGEYRYYGRRMGVESFGAALIVWFLDRPEREQRAILAAGLPVVEQAERDWNREMEARAVKVSHGRDVDDGKGRKAKGA
jgi:hypothetical protein